MNYQYLVYVFGSFNWNLLPPNEFRINEFGADYERFTFGEVIELLMACEGVKANIDVDCIVDGEFVATLRREWEEDWQYLDADSGCTWTAEEWAKDMGASL